MSCKDWEEVTLVDVVSILGDGLHGTPLYDATGEYYFINGNNLSNGKIIFKEDTRKVAYSEYQKYKKNLNDRTIFVSINGTLGNVALYNGEKCILGKSACYFNVKETVDKYFIRYIVTTIGLFRIILQCLQRGQQKNVSLKTMREFPFLLPPLHEQKKIANILSSLDDKIELNNKINDNLAA